MGMVAGGDFFSELQDFCRERESASRCAPFEEICCRYELYMKSIPPHMNICPAEWRTAPPRVNAQSVG